MSHQSQSGNLALCISKSSSNNIDEEKCLDSLDGLLQPLSRFINDDDGEETVARVLNWRYENGLLRAVMDGNGREEQLCLGPTAKALSTKCSKPHEMVLQECPLDESNMSFAEHDERASVLAKTREMRFLITEEGRVQSLAAVFDPEIGLEETSTNPYCLTIMKGEEDVSETAYLVPCQETGNRDVNHALEADEEHALSSDVSKHQVFDIYGTYSGSFLMPFRPSWANKETVELAYQVGLPLAKKEEEESYASAKGAASIEISMLINGKDLQNPPEQIIVDVIPLNGPTASGIFSFTPVGYSLDEGKVTATLRTTNEDGVLLRGKASFWVSKIQGPIGQGSNGSYKMFVLLMGCFVGCFLLSVLAEKIFGNKTRTSGDGSNDGKTVCIFTEEDDDFPLEDDLEEGGGIHKDNDTDGSSNTDLDESRNSTSTMMSIGDSPGDQKVEEHLSKPGDDASNDNANGQVRLTRCLQN
jgi:hypothetical protein